MLADDQNLPRAPLAGWFFKSAFPATAGNLVLLGHVNGEAAIFARLGELEPGDEIRVYTEDKEDKVHIYLVDTELVVDEDAVEVLALVVRGLRGCRRAGNSGTIAIGLTC